MEKFGTLDFCFDVINILDNKNFKYIVFFLQRTNKFNRFTISHSMFSLDEVYNLLPKSFNFISEQVKVGYGTCSILKIEKLLSIIREKQSIQYILMLIHEKRGELEVSFNISSKESIKVSVIAMQNLLEAMKGQFE